MLFSNNQTYIDVFLCIFIEVTQVSHLKIRKVYLNGCGCNIACIDQQEIFQANPIIGLSCITWMRLVQCIPFEGLTLSSEMECQYFIITVLDNSPYKGVNLTTIIVVKCRQCQQRNPINLNQPTELSLPSWLSRPPWKILEILRNLTTKNDNAVFFILSVRPRCVNRRSRSRSKFYLSSINISSESSIQGSWSESQFHI